MCYGTDAMADDATELYMWDLVESTATMMAACIPSLRVFIRDVREKSANYQTSNLPYISGPSEMDSKKSRSGSETTSSESAYHGNETHRVV